MYDRLTLQRVLATAYKSQPVYFPNKIQKLNEMIDALREFDTVSAVEIMTAAHMVIEEFANEQRS